MIRGAAERTREMDPIRRAKLDVLIPILTSAHEVLVDLMDQEQDAFDTTPANLKDARDSKEMLHYLNEAENALDHLIECIKNTSGINASIEMPDIPTPRIQRRV
jgi:hypothetical protein